MLIWKMAFIFHSNKQAVIEGGFKEIIKEDKYVRRFASVHGEWLQH